MTLSITTVGDAAPLQPGLPRIFMRPRTRMPEDPLEDVLTAEREIAELLGTERHKAALWLEERKREIDAAEQTELAAIEQDARAGEETARRAATGKAKAIVEQARALAARLEALDDARLVPVVGRHIASILPGGTS
jgi:flagellar biosynthesis/type III secretory pathway protein FliH